MRPRTALFALGVALLVSISAAIPASARSDVAVTHLPSVFVRVINGLTEQPVAGAEVLVSFVGGDPDRPIITGTFYDASTNGGGHTLFKGVPSGAYIVSVSADGFVSFGDGAHGDRLPTGLSIVLSSFRHGGGGVHVVVKLVPLTACETCPG